MKANILIIDDDRNKLDSLEFILKAMDQNIIKCKSGIEGLRAMLANEIAVILLDVNMPEMDGFETAKLIRSRYKTTNIPIIFITSFKKEEIDVFKGYSLGAIDYIFFPLNEEILLFKVKAFIDLYNAAIQIKQQSWEIKQMNSSLLRSNIEKSDLINKLSKANEVLSNEVTQRKIAEQTIKEQNNELLKTKQYLYELNACKDKFFSIIAHDLKNPFAGILSSCDLLLRRLSTYDTEKIKNKIQMIGSSAKQGCELLGNLLEWSRSQTGNIQFSPKEVNLNQIAETSIRMVKQQANDKNIKIHNHLQDDLLIKADENLLNTVFRNLLTNAIKFTPESGEVTINSMQTENFYEISVADTGIGMPAEIQEQLFRIDSKITSRGTSGEPGTGLGLILCKEFIEMHGGRILAVSEEGKGSEFVFSLPVCLQGFSVS
ncbi:MAG: response regulator [Bacteroidia bacterium]|nr:response regulator [Bacteroidia bacterium]